MHSTEYRIEKTRCAVALWLADGRELAGDIFLHPVSRFRMGPQDAAEFLNEDEPYFALALPEGTMLVAKRNVVILRTPLTDQWTAREGGLDVEVAVRPGITTRGRLFPEVRSGRARLLDYLNDESANFLPLVEPERLALLNCSAVMHVREVA